MSEVDELFARVREACSTRAWSRGVELTRADAVDGVSNDETAIVLRVKAPGLTVAPIVRLYPDDEEWECTCDDTSDACEHVAAAILALRQARKAGRALPASRKAGGLVGYRLAPDGERLRVDRVIVSDGAEAPLDKSVASAEVEASQADLQIDRLLEARRVRSLPHESAQALATLLVDAPDVKLEGREVRVVADPLRARARLEAARGGGYALHLSLPDSLDRVVVPGLALTRAGELCRLAATELCGLRFEKLPRVIHWDRQQAAELVHERLPELEATLDLELGVALPRRDATLEPLPFVEVEQRGAALSVLPSIVYGDPPSARLEGDRLLHLGGPMPARDRRGERAALAALQAMGLEPGRRRDAVGDEAIALADRLRAFEGPVAGSAHLERYADLRADIAFDAERFEASFEGHSATGDRLGATAEDVIAAWERGESAVPLLGGGWGRLPADWLARHGARVADLLRAREASGRLAAHARPALVRLCDALERPRPPELAALASLLDDFAGLPASELPRDLRAELRHYQRAGVDWLCFLRSAELGALLADDMGLGKTLQALCALEPPALVVCPTSVLHGWVEQIDRFRPGLSTNVYHGADRRLDDDADVTLTTYALLRRDGASLGARRWGTVVLDEAQAIKNPDTEAARSAFALHARFRLCLSGTPVENRLEELWSQMHFANPGMLGGRSDFRTRYEQPIASGNATVAGQLRERIRPFVLRRLKEEVATELPPRIEAVLHVELDREEREVYDAVRLAAQTHVVARLREGGSVMEALEALLRLRQAASDAALVPGQAALAQRASSKVRVLMEQLDQTLAGGHKALVFSQWTSLLDRVEPELDAGGMAYCRLDGTTRDRPAVIARFQDTSGPPVMLLSLKAGGVGLNLTAADHVFLLDPWWNPA
ncbi:MAG TPA: SNF2-related protein, partial [Polyangiaceae bacterium]|nr:SNF2-related protein [Polyangiaceae bacterium]